MSKKARIKPQDRVAAAFSEAILSPSYRQALNEDYIQNPDGFIGDIANTQQVLLDSYLEPRSTHEHAWETRRLAIIAQLGGQSFGQFSEYLHNSGGSTKPADLSIEDLPPGEPDAVRINNQIMSLSRLHDDPIDFIDSAFNTIDNYEQKSGNKNKVVGPENYATTFRIFADKFRDFPNSHLDSTLIKDRVHQCLAGFNTVATQNEPNFVEMTNIYVAILTLPPEMVDKEHTTMLATYSAMQLHKLDTKTLSLLIATFGKLDTSDTGDTVANLIDLALRKSEGLQTTKEYRSALRTLSKLPRSSAANRTFATFLEKSHELQIPLDIDGLDEVNQLLVTIVSDVIDDPELSQLAKDIAYKNAYRAVEKFREKTTEGNLTSERKEELKVVVTRIGRNYANV